MKLKGAVLTVFTVFFAAATAARADEVSDWEQVFLNASVTAKATTWDATRQSAIVHAAVFDAVNGVHPKYIPIHVAPAAPPGASAKAAAVMAAYTALINLYPTQKATFDSALQESLAGISSGAAAEHSVSILRGILWGQSVANQILAYRANDGANVNLPPYMGSTALGLWRPTPPSFAPGAGVVFATVTPWVIKSPSVFRPIPPPALTSALYAANFNETKNLGSATSTTRTEEETLFAHFWQNSTATWFFERVAMSLAEQRGFSLAEKARLLAVMSLAMADATIATWDAKYTYSAWRPITAIQLADLDGNPATDVDPAWTSLIPAPPHPEYPSGHSTITCAAVVVLASFFGQDTSFTVDSSSMAGVTRSFTSFTAALAEVKRARIVAGIHFPNSCDAGQSVGEAVGEYVLQNAALRDRGIH
jgi:hypothetical protein